MLCVPNATKRPASYLKTSEFREGGGGGGVLRERDGFVGAGDKQLGVSGIGADHHGDVGGEAVGSGFVGLHGPGARVRSNDINVLTR